MIPVFVGLPFATLSAFRRGRYLLGCGARQDLTFGFTPA